MFAEHQYATAEPETVTYTHISDPLDLTKYFIYMASVTMVTYVSLALGVSLSFVFVIASRRFCLQFILVFVFESLYRRERIRRLFSLDCLSRAKLGRGQNGADTGDGAIQLRCCAVNDQVQEEKVLTQTLVRDRKLNDYAIIVSNLHKSYENVNAVNGIDFVVKKGECFGLLGINGAGKTTTFKMLTHDTTVSKGDIFINGRSCYDQPTEYKSLFGYCPQVDALNSYMTAYEILKYMAWIRGVPRRKLGREVEKWLKRVDLVKYKNVKIKYYSGGTKRKLNTAIAMVGWRRSSDGSKAPNSIPFRFRSPCRS